MPLTVPTLTISDNADGTGAVVTIANSTAGATNVVYVAPWYAWVGQAYVNRGSRVGNGTVAIAPGLGYFSVEVQSTKAGEDGVRSLLHNCRITAGEAAEFDQKLDGVAAKIQALSLSGFLPEDVRKQKFPWKRGVPAAGIFVTPLSDEFRYVLNQADDFNDAIQVTTVKASNENLTDGISSHLMVRQQLVNAFLPNHGNPALAGVSVVHDVTVRPGPVFDARSFEAHFDVSVIVVIPVSRRTRGLV